MKCWWIAVCVAGLVGLQAIGEEAAVVNVAKFASAKSLTGGIQEAIDALPKGGGTVVIPPGTYVLRRRVNLSGKHNVTLKGSGPDTILARPDQAFARLTETASCRANSVAVDSTDGFQVGDEVVVYDAGSVGWNLGHNYVKAVLPGRIELAGAFENMNWIPVGWQYKVERRAAIINRFPALAAGQTKADNPTRGVRIFDLTIDGNLKKNTSPWTDFTTAGIHFNNPVDLLVRGVTVRGWPSDGISVQWGSRVRVENCLVERCVGHGLHPGTSIRDVTMVKNTSRYNTGDGFFFCFDVQKALVADNVFLGNLGSGIGNLGYRNMNNIVENNRIEANHLWGVDARSGKNNVIRGNVCKGNSRAQPGKYSEIVLHNNTGSVVTKNTCISLGGPGVKVTRRFAIEAGGHGKGNTIRDNICKDAVRLWPSAVSAAIVTFPHVMLRFDNAAFLAVTKGARVEVVLRSHPVGNNKGPTAWSVKDSRAQQLASGSIAAGEKHTVSFTPHENGLCVLSVAPGWAGCSLVSANVPLALGAHSKLTTINGAERLYFHVPAGVERFTVAARGKPPETVRLNIFNPAGKQVATAQTSAQNKKAEIEVAASDGVDAVWSLQLTKADTGRFEDCSVILDDQVSPLSLVPEHVFRVGKSPPP